MAVEDQLRGGSRFGVRAVVMLVVALVAAALFAGVLALVATSAPWLIDLDRRISRRLHGFALSHHTYTTVMKVISDIGSPVAWWIILAVTVGWLLFRRLWRLAAFAVVTGIGSSLINHIVKLSVGRARPHLSDPVAVAAGKSFPSGHAQSAIVGYGILLAIFLPVIAPRLRRLAVAIAAALVLLIGFSRIALGVHYLSDVIGAYLIGAVWLIGMISVFRTWRRESGDRPTALKEGLEPEHRARLEP